MQTARTPAELALALQPLPPPALVPTMGALHAGHLALVAAARAVGPVVGSIFVNPLQFAADEDLGRYPRDEAGDLAALRQAGCAVAFLPAAGDIYPPGDATTIDVAGPALGFEGARRPGHFRGVATVVARLIHLTAAGTAWFGQKDWQQLQVVRRMAADLRLRVAIRDVPTAREPDGLALSSRNRFLDAAQRATAPALAGIASAAVDALRQGAALPPTLDAAIAQLTALGFDVDYLAAVEPATMAPLQALDGPARLVAAARLGTVRLLDNFAI